MKHKLKIGILIDDTQLEYYKLEILKEIQKSDFCEITKFITQEKEINLETQSSKYFLYRLFNKVDAKLFGRGTKYLGLKSIEDIIKSCANEEAPDVIINLSSSTEHYPNEAKYGMWQFIYNSFPNAYWEVINNDPYTEVTLQKRGSGFECGLILKTYKTITDQKSMLKNRDLAVWQSHMMVIRELKKLFEDGDEYLKQKRTQLSFNNSKTSNKKQFLDPRFNFSDKKYHKPPTNLEMVGVICKLLKKYTIFSIRKFFPMNRWFLLYSKNKSGKMDSKLSNYKRLYAPSKEYFWADPFVIDDGSDSYLFFEELDYSTYKGCIKVSKFNDKTGIFDKPEIALDKEYHLSYPNVFKYKGKFYMVPESIENKTIDLFEAEDFPTKWKKKKTLLNDILAVDATFHFHNEKWWMFVSLVEKDDFSTDNELSIFYSDDIIDGNWTAHPQNPVVCDVTSARPAGNLIEKSGRLYRPAQDCSGFYGRKIVINEIDVLNETQFKEHTVSELNSDFADDLVGVHTLNSSYKFTILDAIKSR